MWTKKFVNFGRDLLDYLTKLVKKRATDLKHDLISTLIVEQVGRPLDRWIKFYVLC